VLSARVDLHEGNFRSARQHLEDVRSLLRRAEERGRRLGWRDEVERLGLARFEADIHEAQRLLEQLEQGANSLVRQETLPSREQVNEGHEESGADDRPQHLEGMPADVNHEGFGQLEARRDPGPDEGADEPERRGHDEPPAGPTGDRFADGPADGRDDDEEDESR